MGIDPSAIRIDTAERRPAPRPAHRPSPRPVWPAVLALVVGIAGLSGWMAIGSSMVARGVADELVDQYQLLIDAKASQLELGVRAGAVAEAYLQANDAEGYREWKAAADRHMRAAGMPAPR